MEEFFQQGIEEDGQWGNIQDVVFIHAELLSGTTKDQVFIDFQQTSQRKIRGPENKQSKNAQPYRNGQIPPPVFQDEDIPENMDSLYSAVNQWGNQKKDFVERIAEIAPGFTQFENELEADHAQR